MELFLKRKYFRPDYTIGHLYLMGEATGGRRSPGAYLCDTLEPASRGLTARSSLQTIRAAKQAGTTAIPTGRYRVLITRSARFGRWLPLLLGVPGYEGIRIHAGNTPRHTRGCILPGMNRRRGYVLDSTQQLQRIMRLVEAAIDRGETVWISVSENGERRGCFRIGSSPR